MRDIVNTNDFSAASAEETKNKLEKTPSNSGTLTRPDYRSYRDFLESYNDNKNSKDDQESVSSTDSGISSYKLSESKSNNTSTSSLNSEINCTNLKPSTKSEQTTGFCNRTGSFRNYLESYNNKKFSSVKPSLPPKKNLIKSEIVIQVNNPLEKHQGKTEPDSCCVTTINGDNFDFMSSSINMEVPDFPPPPPPLQIEENHIEECAVNYPPPPPPPPKLPDFTKSNTDTASIKKWASVKAEDDRPKSNSAEKPPVNDAAANLAKILTQHLLPRRKALETEIHSTEGKICSKPTNGGIQTQLTTNSLKNEKNVITAIPPAPKLPTDNVSSDKPPKMGKNFGYVPVVPKMVNGESSLSKTEIFKNSKQPTHLTQKMIMVESATPKLPHISQAKTLNGRSSSPNNGSVEFNTTTVVPITEGATKVSKNDPNVRKLVYNTYRGLLGAYNNKANDMISTLPRNMVREDQGITKQLESMALQGGLEKLNGRTNPNVEQE